MNLAQLVDPHWARERCPERARAVKPEEVQTRAAPSPRRRCLGPRQIEVLKCMAQFPDDVFRSRELGSRVFAGNTVMALITLDSLMLRGGLVERSGTSGGYRWRITPAGLEALKA